MITGSDMHIGFGLLEFAYDLVITYKNFIRIGWVEENSLMRSTPFIW